MFKELQREAQMILDGVIELTYWMRGAITYEEMLRRTHGERDRISAFVEKRLSVEAKKPYPQY